MAEKLAVPVIGLWDPQANQDNQVADPGTCARKHTQGQYKQGE
jgi:hypothetical protein